MLQLTWSTIKGEALVVVVLVRVGRTASGGALAQVVASSIGGLNNMSVAERTFTDCFTYIVDGVVRVVVGATVGASLLENVGWVLGLSDWQSQGEGKESEADDGRVEHCS